jgi:hypothetical protein
MVLQIVRRPVADLPDTLQIRPPVARARNRARRLSADAAGSRAHQQRRGDGRATQQSCEVHSDTIVPQVVGIVERITGVAVSRLIGSDLR